MSYEGGLGMPNLTCCLQEWENTDETVTDKWCVRRTERRGETGEDDRKQGEVMAVVRER